MGRRNTKEWTRVRETFAIQREIIDTLGEKAIKAARQRLCEKCQEGYCPLLPILLDGSDCPYFKRREEED